MIHGKEKDQNWNDMLALGETNCLLRIPIVALTTTGVKPVGLLEFQTLTSTTIN